MKRILLPSTFNIPPLKIPHMIEANNKSPSSHDFAFILENKSNLYHPYL